MTIVASKRQAGSALIITTLVLLLVTVLALTSLQDSEMESTAGARSRATARTLYAADAGIQLALARLSQSPPNLDPFAVDLADGASVESRTRSDPAPEVIHQVALGEASEGYSLNVDGGATDVTRIFELNVTAESANSATAELEARLGREEVIATGY
jgi:Tfp pilus assembly protein PilX